VGEGAKGTRPYPLPHAPSPNPLDVGCALRTILILEHTMDDLAYWVNQEILNLWRNKFKKDKSALMPLIYSEIKTSVLLFVSLNPSFTTKGFKRLLEN
jgi:hypothetical protein